ncbi:MAG: PAS domain S-box protein [Bacteroidales bacterium]|nr:PAS domain S-box protein [Bacteroidales bacterium]
MIASRSINNYLFETIHKLSFQSESLKKAKNDLEYEIEQNQKIRDSFLQSEKKFKEMFNVIEDALIIFDNKYTIIDANSSFLKLTGLYRDELGKISLSEYIDEIQRTDKSNVFENQFSFNNEHSIRAKNDELIPVEFTIISVNDKEGLNLAIIKDIRDKKALEKQVLNAIIKTEEKERTRISRDLHDCLGPLLSAVKLYSTSINSSDIDPKYIQLSSRITDMMDEAIKSVKEISNNLSSHLLKQFGIYEALKSFSEKIQNSYPIQVNIEFPPQLKPDEEIQITIYRVLVELISNTIKHAEANSITMRAGVKNEKLIFIYKDNGKGFDVNKVLEEKKEWDYTIYTAA